MAEIMSSFLKSKKMKVPDQSRSSNSINGSDAETLAASLLVTACRGEICWGSREEDNSKIDLILSIEHPWYAGERLLLLVQVKSGDSYGQEASQGFKLKGAAIKAAKRTSHPICIVWVSRETNQAYWAYVKPNSNQEAREYSSYHQISPATIYDLARCASTPIHSYGGNGIIIRKHDGNLKDRRKDVEKKYRSFKEIQSPTLGAVELTRFGWRHMFRRSRSAKYKDSSLVLIPYLKLILSQYPTEHAITEHEVWNSKGYVYRRIEHLLKYSKVMLSAKEYQKQANVTVLLKTVEEIRYPENWAKNAMLSQCIDRRVVLKSAYFKLN